MVKAAPPPLGGDVPGFLAAGDLPPAGDADESWVATPAEPPSETFLGSQCELINWSRVDAASGSTRVYLVPSSTKFGLNDIVLTMKDEKAATALVAKIKGDLQSCSKRKLTATVSRPAAVKGVGAQGAAVTGWTSTVSQKSTSGTQRYRVGIVSSGTEGRLHLPEPASGGLRPQPVGVGHGGGPRRSADDAGALSLAASRNANAGDRPAAAAFVRRPAQAGATSELMISRISCAVSLGVLPTLTPAASSASFFAAAVPEEPETMAPAWPMVLPSGAVNPAT